jgi:hypothetical protein
MHFDKKLYVFLMLCLAMISLSAGTLMSMWYTLTGRARQGYAWFRKVCTKR